MKTHMDNRNQKTAASLSRVCATALVGALLVGAVSAWASNIASVNGKMITDKEVQNALSSMTGGQRAALLRDPVARRKLVINLIDQEVMAEQGAKDKLDQEADFKMAMETARRNLLNDSVIRRYIDPKITASSAKKWFESRKTHFTTDVVYVQHILMNDEASAIEMMGKVKAKGADFNALAEKYSKDPSAKNNRGDLGPITRTSPLVDDFKDAAFATAKGEVTGPVRTDFGYHIIKVVDRKSGRQLDFDEVELQVKAQMRQDLVNDYLTSLKKSAKITIDEKAVEKL